MKPAMRKNILIVIIVLGIINLLTCIYLLNSHYTPPIEGALCDWGETVSCSVVNTSVYSKFLSVPVALSGAIWCVLLLFMCKGALKKDKVAVPVMLAWSIAGSLFVIYMIVAEFILKAICPFCTLAHAAIFITFILAAILYKAEGKKLKKEALFEAAKPWIGTILFFNVIPIIIFNLPLSETENPEALAQCLTEKGMRMYSSVYCGSCRAQEKSFGEAFQYIDYVECHPDGEDPQLELCVERGIPHTPAWILEKDGVEVKRIMGYQRLKTLAEFAGCPLEEETENG